MTTNGEEVLRYFYKPRSIHDAYREYESHAEPGFMPWATFYRRSREYIVQGRIRKTKDGYMLRHPIKDIEPMFQTFGNLFWQNGDTALDSNPLAWYVEHMIESHDPQAFTRKFLERCDLVHMGQIVEFYNQMIETPNDALSRISAQMDLSDPTGERRKHWVEVIQEHRNEA